MEKTKQTKQNGNTLIYTENKWVAAREKGCGGGIEQVKGLKRYKPPVRKGISHGGVTHNIKYGQ